MIDHRRPQRRQTIQRRRMTLQKFRRASLHIEYKVVQSPGLCDRGIQLPQGSCREIPGICRRPLSQRLHPFVKGLEGLVLHIDLAPQLEVITVQRQSLRHRRDHRRVLRHILADMPVSPGLRQGKRQSLFRRLVPERHAESVNLLLHRKGSRGMQSMHSVYPFRHLFLGKHIFNRKHGHVMGHLHPGLPLRRTTDLLRR